MAQHGFDIALGREVEFYWRVDNQDPVGCALVLVVLAHSGLETDAVIRTYTDLNTLLTSSTNAEATNTGYERIYLDDTDLAAYTVDTTNHRANLPLAEQTFPTISAGDIWSKLLVCYDPDSATTIGSDSEIIPFAAHDIRRDGAPVSPNGNDINMAFPYGILTAS